MVVCCVVTVFVGLVIASSVVLGFVVFLICSGMVFLIVLGSALAGDDSTDDWEPDVVVAPFMFVVVSVVNVVAGSFAIDVVSSMVIVCRVCRVCRDFGSIMVVISDVVLVDIGGNTVSVVASVEVVVGVDVVNLGPVFIVLGTVLAAIGGCDVAPAVFFVD